MQDEELRPRPLYIFMLCMYIISAFLQPKRLWTLTISASFHNILCVTLQMAENILLNSQKTCPFNQNISNVEVNNKTTKVQIITRGTLLHDAQILICVNLWNKYLILKMNTYLNKQIFLIKQTKQNLPCINSCLRGISFSHYLQV